MVKDGRDDKVSVTRRLTRYEGRDLLPLTVGPLDSGGKE